MNHTCMGENRTERVECLDNEESITCPHLPDYWMNHKQWPLPNETSVTCLDPTDPKSELTWSSILQHPPDSTWYLLARYTIATRLSIASGAASNSDTNTVLNYSLALLSHCDEFSPTNEQHAQSLIKSLQSYSNGDMDPTTLSYQGSIRPSTVGSAQVGGGGAGDVSGERSGLVATVVVVPIVIVAVVAVAVWVGMRAWRSRYNTMIKEDDEEVDLQELRNKIDEDQKEEEEPLDEGALEDLQL